MTCSPVSRRGLLRAGLTGGIGLCFGRGARASKASAAESARITEVEAHPVQIDRIYTTKVAPAGGHPGGKEASRFLLLELKTEDGLRGIGELSDVEDAWDMPPVEDVRGRLRKLLVGTNAAERRRTVEQLRSALPEDWHRELKRLLVTAVDMALLDLAGRALSVPAYELLGGRCRTRLPISWVAFIRETAFLQQEVEEKVRAGFRAFKLKVGEDFEADCEHVRAIRRVAGPENHLRVDASGSWGTREAVERIRRLAALGVDAVETPIRAASRTIAKEHPGRVNNDVERVAKMLATVREAVPVPLIEHVVDFSDAFALALAEHKSVDTFNVAVSQAGGVERARRLIHAGEAAGIGVLLGSTVELGPGTAAALHVGAASRGVTVPSDLVGPGLLEDDVVTEPFDYDGRGRLTVPTGPGLGVSLDPGKLRRYRSGVSNGTDEPE